MKVYDTYHHVHLVSRDPEAAAAWYEKALGAEISGQGQGKSSLNVRIKLGEANISIRGLRDGEVAPAEDPPPLIGLHHIGLMVDDIEWATRSVAENGGKIIEAPHTGISGNIVAHVECPEGVMIEFLQPKS